MFSLIGFNWVMLLPLRDPCSRGWCPTLDWLHMGHRLIPEVGVKSVHPLQGLKLGGKVSMVDATGSKI